MIAHIDIPGSVPWIDEFFGHPYEYWPVYLFISTLICAVVYMAVQVHYLSKRESSLSDSVGDLFKLLLTTQAVATKMAINHADHMKKDHYPKPVSGISPDESHTLRYGDNT